MNAEPTIPSTRALFTMIEDVALRLVERNQPELGWQIRGMADRLNPEVFGPEENPAYASDYMWGYGDGVSGCGALHMHSLLTLAVAYCTTNGIDPFKSVGGLRDAHTAVSRSF